MNTLEDSFPDGFGMDVPFVDSPKFDEHFRKHIDVYAEKHPGFIVRQLASRLSKAWSETEDLIKQRDELIDALEEIKKKVHGYTDKHIHGIATKAIAKAKGEK